MAGKVKAAPPERWTESRVFELLKGPFPDGAFVRIPQVRNGTGYSSKARTCDALIVSCWPSRGLWFAGVEIKVSVSDWKRELANPHKSAVIQKWCDHWYIAAPAGVVPIFELPPTWGLIECSARGCKIAHPAPKLKPVAVDAAFVCSVLRASTESMVPRLEMEALAEKRASEKVESRNYELDNLREHIERFEKECGISISSRWDHGDISEALQLVKKTKVGGVRALASYMKGQAERLVRTGDEVIALCDAVLADPKAGQNIGPSAVDSPQ